MNIFKTSLVLFPFLFVFSGFDIQPAKSQNSINVMAYYMAPRENYKPQDLPLEKLTHIIFSFTEVIDNEMKFKNPALSEKLSLLVEQKKNHPFFAKVLRSESQHIIKGLGGTEEGANDMCVSSGSSRRCMRIGEGDEGGEGSVVQRCHAIDLLCTQTKRDELALGW